MPTQRRTVIRRRPTPGRPASLLVLQLDSEKLRAGGLSLAPFARNVVSLVPRASIEIIEATTRRDLLDQLARLATAKRTCDVVVAVGHSNEDGIQIACDEFADWNVFAAYVKPFEPRRMMLVACDAGRWPAAAMLFQKLPKLRRIFASPVPATKELGQFMIAMIPYLLAVKAPPAGHVLTAQVALAALTGGQVRQWVRTRDKDKPESVLLDMAAQIVDPFVRKVPEILASIVRPGVRDDG